MPFVLMAVVSGAVAVWLFGFPSRPAHGGDRPPRLANPRRAILVVRPTAGDVAMLVRPSPAGIRGWLFCYVVLLGLQALHSLGLSVAAPIIKARPALAGLHSFVPLPSLVFYEASNLTLVTYTVALYVLMVRRRKSAIVHNVICNVLAVGFLVCWHFLGMKSGVGMIVDGLPSLIGACYILASRRVRSTCVLR